MKKIIYLKLLLIIIASCTGTRSSYEETIRDFVETDKYGTQYDLKFKVLEINKIGSITAADSINILTEEFKKDQELIVNRIELAKEMAEKQMNLSKRQSDIDKYQKNIDICTHRIDSLKNLVPSNLNGYDNRNPDEVLALIIRCKYSILLPNIGTTAEETFDFYLSPDGDKCFGKERAN